MVVYLAVATSIFVTLTYFASRSGEVFKIFLWSLTVFLALLAFLVSSETLVSIEDSQTFLISCLFVSALFNIVLVIERDHFYRYFSSKKESYEFKKSILQIAAHEIRTPIASVKTNIDIALHYSAMERHKDVDLTLRKCYSDIDSLDQQANAILSLSALESGSLTKKLRKVRLPELFTNIERIHSVKVKAKPNLYWYLESSSDTSSYYLDPELTTIILSNAIDNAIKYTNSGYIKVFYRVIDEVLTVSIQDSGVGMTEEEITYLLKLPGQLNETIRRSADGWGIGFLAMGKFTEFLGGSISIDSKKHFGTKITIQIPVRSAQSQSEGSYLSNPTDELKEEKLVATSQSQTGFVGARGTEAIKVLVIDNDEQHLLQMRELFSPDLLRRNDVSVCYCSNASEALELVEDFAFDLILVDYHMPGIDGLKFLEYLAQNEHRSTEAVKVLLTADSSIPDGVRRKVQALSARIMHKGISSSDARDLIRKVSLKSVS